MNNGWIYLPTPFASSAPHLWSNNNEEENNNGQKCFYTKKTRSYDRISLVTKIFDDHLVDSFFNVECFENDNKEDLSFIAPIDGMDNDHVITTNGVDEGLHLVHVAISLCKGCELRAQFLKSHINTNIQYSIAISNLQPTCSNGPQQDSSS